MPDYTLSDLRDYARILDLLALMGAAAQTNGQEATFSLWPGQSPVVRLKGLTVPLGVPGIGDPVHSVVPAASIDFLSMPSDFKHPGAARTSSPATAEDGLLIAVPDEQAPETTADATASLVQGGAGQSGDTHTGLAKKKPQASLSFRKAQARPDLWTPEEEASMVELVVAGCQRGLSIHAAAHEAAAQMGRNANAVRVRASVRKEQIFARLEELRAQGVEFEMTNQARPQAWTAEEDSKLVDGIARRMLEGKSRHKAASEMAAVLGRPIQGVKHRAKTTKRVSIDARLAVLQAEQGSAPVALAGVEEAGPLERAAVATVPVPGPADEVLGGEPGGLQLHHHAENAPVQGAAGACDGVAAAAPEAAQPVEDASPQGSSPALEQAGAVAADFRPLPAAQSEQTPAPADDLPADEAQVVALKAEMAKADLPRVPGDALTDHLLRPMTRRGRRLADDLDLVRMLIAKMPTGIIATELAMQPHEVTACYDRLTGYNVQRRTRSYGLPEVEARLRVLVAHETASAA